MCRWEGYGFEAIKYGIGVQKAESFGLEYGIIL